MNLALWIIQGWLAALFLGTAIVKLTKSKAELERIKGMGYVTERTAVEMKLIGVVEVLGALGLILPWLFGVAPVLTPLAAVGLAITMVGAVATHLRRKEPVLLPSVLLVLALFVAIGRFGLLG